MGKAADSRKTNDFFPTPAAICLAALWECVPFDLQPKRILDPGAGSGAWGAAARQRYGDNVQIYGVEYRDVPMPAGYNVWLHTNFLNMTVGALMTLADGFDLAIGNPPYGIDIHGNKDKNLVEKFVRKTFGLIREGGYITFLLRMNFLSGGTRMRSFWRTHAPVSVTVLGDRPSFTGDGKTEANGQYAIYTFQKGFNGDTTLRWLDWRNYTKAAEKHDAPPESIAGRNRQFDTEPAQQSLTP